MKSLEGRKERISLRIKSSSRSGCSCQGWQWVKETSTQEKTGREKGTGWKSLVSVDREEEEERMKINTEIISRRQDRSPGGEEREARIQETGISQVQEERKDQEKSPRRRDGDWYWSQRKTMMMRGSSFFPWSWKRRMQTCYSCRRKTRTLSFLPASFFPSITSCCSFLWREKMLLVIQSLKPESSNATFLPSCWSNNTFARRRIRGREKARKAQVNINML